MNKLPFSFVLDTLSDLVTDVKPMFGCHALYTGEKILMIQRKKSPADPDNGIWIATERHHHDALKKDFPSLRPIAVLGAKGSWLNLPEESEDFEQAAFDVCELIRKKDPRIGKVPAKKKARNMSASGKRTSRVARKRP